ncbi:MAG TPA: formate dehydrogenase accessory sulfurtransferase FdhD [Saprospiraceae bacterium]|nr:formate dehydrogenase accessory sulfurtransferase FdhD [Saprospiraceae bacterium]MCC6687820.1 formate dehydrogenase accessory sulfurtransferase FdhD [Saprospiraceae bacterium]HMV22923.1 formate dehydrogenase accessory sulfurtransferase FdhD [Saprospiraceae bacterium]HMX82763.1 formate dehydrogenase accessory sulfurtransferase FdhD [Saprospiraceae bacterium]HMX84510.1 formate dehydrogenase accessory sulfurtransferase FdhD [Saprospiraceae bacterium]
MNRNIHTRKIHKLTPENLLATDDFLAVEEPLEIKIVYGPKENRISKTISITMRTPGEDRELALGFLFTEGIINQPADILATESTIPSFLNQNTIEIQLSDDANPDIHRLDRHFYTTSSCGVCGKSSIDALKTIRMPKLKADFPVFDRNVILSLPSLLTQLQSVFEKTGGIHASAIFDKSGKLLLLKEDVGRHNALDKIAGAALQQGLLPLSEQILLVSGRASFELVQKAAMIGVPLMAAVGAPSSLAAELAEEAGITLVGFLNGKRFNIYTHPGRIL